MFKLAILGSCVAWRQTRGCNPDGPRETNKDNYDCSVEILDDWSGYCECTDGSKRMKKGCQKGSYRTCNEACSDVKRFAFRRSESARKENF